MDPLIAWFQPEQSGPSNELWERVWEQTQRGLELFNMVTDMSTAVAITPDCVNGGEPNGLPFPCKAADFISIDSESKSTGELSNPPLPLRTPLLRPNSEMNGKRKWDNRASTFDLNRNRSRLIGEYGGTPWKPREKVYSAGLIGLHEEIEDFYKYICPTKEEQQVREDVFQTIKNVILDMWPEAIVDYFGSYRTGLYLPTSDIDVVVMGKWSSAGPYFNLEKEIRSRGFADPESIKVLDRASVPIVKLTHKRSDMKVDISFNTSNGVKSATLIQEYCKRLPALPKLVYVLKQFLLQRDLNEVFTGGISSYSLILMTVSFLQMHPYLDTTRDDLNLGALLMEFFELYGRNFNYYEMGISVKDRQYLKKDAVQRDEGNRSSVLWIEDPLQPSNDIGRSSYGAMRVKQSFEYAYMVLFRATDQYHSRFVVNENESILGRIIRVTDYVVNYRRQLKEQFPSAEKPSLPPFSYASVVSKANPTTQPQNSSKTLHIAKHSSSCSSESSGFDTDSENLSPSHSYSNENCLASQRNGTEVSRNSRAWQMASALPPAQLQIQVIPNQRPMTAQGPHNQHHQSQSSHRRQSGKPKHR